MTGLELQLATAVVRELSGHGVVKLEYITAEFEPFSSAHRPDLVFWPDSGPNQGRAFLIELRMPIDVSRHLPTAENLLEHREFVESDFEDRPYFALATARKVDEAEGSVLSAHGIQVFDSIESAEDLSTRILRWSRTARI